MNVSLHFILYVVNVYLIQVSIILHIGTKTLFFNVLYTVHCNMIM